MAEVTHLELRKLNPAFFRSVFEFSSTKRSIFADCQAPSPKTGPSDAWQESSKEIEVEATMNDQGCS